MIRLILMLELLFFFAAGTQIVRYEKNCARMEATSAVLLSLPVSALSDVSI